MRILKLTRTSPHASSHHRPPIVVDSGACPSSRLIGPHSDAPWVTPPQRYALTPASAGACGMSWDVHIQRFEIDMNNLYLPPAVGIRVGSFGRPLASGGPPFRTYTVALAFSRVGVCLCCAAAIASVGGCVAIKFESATGLQLPLLLLLLFTITAIIQKRLC